MADAIVSVEPARKRRKSPVGDQFRWAFWRPMNLEQLALMVQRISGVALLIYLFFHVFVTGFVASGQGAWEAIMEMLSHPLAHFGEFLVFVGVIFHGINGIRIVLLELSPLVGTPARPDYPYKAQSLGRGQKSILYISAVMTALAAVSAFFLLLW